MKSDNLPYIVYADMETLTKKGGNFKNNQEKFSTTTKGKHVPCRYSM